MTEPAILVLRQPVKLPAEPGPRGRPLTPAPDRFRTAKARDCFQPIDQLLARLDRARQKGALA